MSRSPGSGLAGRLIDHALVGIAAAADRGRSSPAAPGYNPVVFVGPAGAGKSRIVGDLFMRHAVPSAAAATRSPPARLWDGRSLGREIIEAVTGDTLHRLHARFAGAPLVIVDGVEQMAAWDAQRCLALLIDVAVAAGTVVVATLRTHPTACTGLDPALASRLSGGLVVTVPTAGMRGRTRVQRPAEGSSQPSLRRIMGGVARRHGLAVADLVGPARRRSVVLARGEAMYLARALTGRPLAGIGRAFGGRDHTTVLHGIRMIDRLRTRDPVLAAEIDRAIESLGRPAGRRRRRPPRAG